MRHRLAVAATAVAAGIAAGPAGAVPPQQLEVDPPPRIVQDLSGAICGFPVRWTIDLEARVQNFFDADGRLVRQQAHVREENTIANLESGLVLREGPDSFMQTIHFNEDGTIQSIVATGLAVNVQGDEKLKDVGRVVLVPTGPGTFEIAFSAGPHPVREATSGPLVEALAAFCDVLS